MFGENKASQKYLEQISRHVDEKTSLVREALKADNLPRNSEDKLMILELGIGSGDSAKKLQVESGDKAMLFGIDAMPELAHRAKKLDIPSVVADVAHLPIRDSSLSAINASAVFHEVSSYGTQTDSGRIFGNPAIRIAMEEVTRVLLPNGLLAYRDIASPIGDFQEKKTSVYREASLSKFVGWFLPEFLESGPRFYSVNDVKIDNTKEGSTITAPVGLHREIQRHYLTLRHYVRASLAETNTTAPSDEMLDKAIENALSNTSMETRNACEEWKGREGREWYIYSSPTNVTIIACQNPVDGYVLFPSSPNQVTRLRRRGSSVYLTKVIDNPEFDGKLMIGFRKIKLGEARQLLQDKFMSDKRTAKFLDYPSILSVLNS